MSTASEKPTKVKKRVKPTESQASSKNDEEEFTIHPTIDDYQSLDSSNEDRIHPGDADESIVFTRCPDLGTMQTDEVSEEYRRKGARPKVKSTDALPAEQLHSGASAQGNQDTEDDKSYQKYKKNISICIQSETDEYRHPIQAASCST